ncbi:transcription factor bHLH146-like [Trifolium pratense]|uniref:transcription factor bHLH146-like n=1 Tax=Trifolium pratense TaxID=57577 RepID=UPI0008456A22|nr:transcription factor bHLH146-like [Trifolium pratense]
MEGQQNKRKRVYSVEPNKVMQAKFSRNYINYLAPALMKIKERRSSIEAKNVENVVKYEVDMAMVFSSQGFAWSNALKLKLQKDGGEGSSRINYQQNDMGPLDFSKKNCSKFEASKILEEKKLVEENEIVDDQLRCLRKLIPGGEEIMCDEQMVSELESYVSCLQMQVNILKCLTD